jgi:hypothetical protein
LDLIAELLVGLAVFPLSFERQGFVDVWQAVELEAKFTRIAAYGYGCPAVVTQAMVTPFPTSTSVGYDISDFFGRVLWPSSTKCQRRRTHACERGFAAGGRVVEIERLEFVVSWRRDREVRVGPAAP